VVWILLFGIIESHETNELCGQEANLKKVVFEKCSYFVVVLNRHVNFVQMQCYLRAETKSLHTIKSHYLLQKSSTHYHKLESGHPNPRVLVIGEVEQNFDYLVVSKHLVFAVVKRQYL
jgi:hypothetical protein